MKVNCFLIAIIAFWLFLFLYQIGDYARWDEVPFLEAAKSSNLRYNPSHDDLALWHPPLYIIFLSVSCKLIPKVEIAARLVNLILFALSIMLLCISVSRYNQNAPYILLLIILSMPFVLQSILFIDYTVISFWALSIFIAVIFNKKYINRFLYFLFIIISIFLCCWSSLAPIPALLLTSPIIFYVISKNIKLVFTQYVAMIIGVILFVFSYYLYCQALGLPWLTTYLHALYTSSKSGLGNIESLQKIICWLGIPFILLFTFIIYREKFNRSVYFGLLLFGVTLFVQYSVTAYQPYGFPKHILHSMPFIIASMSIFVADIINRNNIERIELFFIFILVSIYYFLDDPLLNLGNKVPWLPVWLPGQTTIRIVLPALILMFILTLLLKYNRKNIGYFLLNIFFLAIIIMGMALNIRQAFAKYETRYVYGSMGFGESIQYILQNTDEDDKIGGPYDIVYYLKDEKKYLSILPSVIGNIKYPVTIDSLINNLDFIVLNEEMETYKYYLYLLPDGPSYNYGRFHIYYKKKNHHENISTTSIRR